MTLPNFLILGAAKSGTTALHTYLQQHPQIFMTPEKETNFFAFEGEELDFQGPGDDAINQFSITALSAYQSEFGAVQDEPAIGEACPLYLYHPRAANRIHAYVPNAKLIIILRNPVDRAYANYLHLVRDGREPAPDFSQALQQESQRIEKNWEWFWHYIQQGYYQAQIERYYQQFSQENIRIYLYEDLRDHPQTLFKSIFNFLEVDSEFIPNLSIRPNKSGKPKNRLLHQVLTQPNPIKTILKPLFPAHLRQKIQHRNLAKPSLSLEVRQRLLDLYQDDICRCQTLIQRDLSAWLQLV